MKLGHVLIAGAMYIGLSIVATNDPPPVPKPDSPIAPTPVCLDTPNGRCPVSGCVYVYGVPICW